MTTRPNGSVPRYEAARTVYAPPVLEVTLRYARLARGLSLRQLADLLPAQQDGTRWGKTYLGYVETGARAASPELMAAVVEALIEFDAKKLPHMRTDAAARLQAPHVRDNQPQNNTRTW